PWSARHRGLRVGGLWVASWRTPQPALIQRAIGAAARRTGARCRRSQGRAGATAARILLTRRLPEACGWFVARGPRAGIIVSFPRSEPGWDRTNDHLIKSPSWPSRGVLRDPFPGPRRLA